MHALRASRNSVDDSLQHSLGTETGASHGWKNLLAHHVNQTQSLNFDNAAAVVKRGGSAGVLKPSAIEPKPEIAALIVAVASKKVATTAALVEPRQKKIENRVQVQVLEGRTTAVGGVLIATDRDLDLEHPSLDLEELLEDMVAVGVGRRRGSKARQVVKQTGRCGRVHSGKQNKSATMSPSSPSTLPPCPTLHPGTRAQP